MDSNLRRRLSNLSHSEQDDERVESLPKSHLPPYKHESVSYHHIFHRYYLSTAVFFYYPHRSTTEEFLSQVPLHSRATLPRLKPLVICAATRR